jgi:hypothetical protein
MIDSTLHSESKKSGVRRRITGYLAGVLYLGAVILALAVSPVSAHVSITYPDNDPGVVVESGSFMKIEWFILVDHPLKNWDLWYSVSGPGGPWIELVTDLPGGDTTINSEHSYNWLVPDIESDQMRIRIRQDNVEFDWEDTSRVDFAISGNCCDGLRGNIDGDEFDQISITDLTVFVDWLFGGSEPPYCPEEANVDASNEAVDISDLTYLISYLFGGGPSPSFCP